MGPFGLGKTLSEWQVTKLHKKGSFWWRGNLKLLDSYKGMASVSLQDGATYYFWTDLWGGQVN